MSPRAAARGRAPWKALAGVAALAALLGWWLREPAAVAAEQPQAAAIEQPMASPSPAPPAPANLPASGPPLSPLGDAQRREQLRLWQGRLERARIALQTYEQTARYPHESRPIEEHPDQLRPFDPIAEDHPLRMPGGSVSQGMRLKTTQERVFAAGSESSRITVTLQDDLGRTLPLRITRAVLREVTPPGRTASTTLFAMPINDAGVNGDEVAGDGIHTVVMQPARQGFGDFAGTVRLELNLEYAGQPGFLYFDLIYSPEQAASWLPGVREALEDGSLAFYPRAQVRVAGRYVVSGRIFDAQGQPVALAQFNAEAPAGVAEFRLPVFGRLLRERKPALPLQLRDVEAFLLKPDTFPDRVMLPRLAGVVHTSKVYPLSSFSEAAWTSEERTRYLTELGKDVAQAEDKVRQLGP